MLDSEYLKTLVSKAAEFGDGKIHIIVNNAGYTWDGVIHKVEHLQYHMGLRYLATDWETLDLGLRSSFDLELNLSLEEEDHCADLVLGSIDDGQAMGEHHCPP